MYIMVASVAIIDAFRFIREIKEDDDDWFNKTRRKAKRVARTITRALAPKVPVAPAA